MYNNRIFHTSDNTFSLAKFIEVLNAQHAKNSPVFACLRSLRYLTRGAAFSIWVNDPNNDHNIVSIVKTCNIVNAFAKANGFSKLETFYVQPENHERYNAFLPENTLNFIPPASPSP